MNSVTPKRGIRAFSCPHCGVLATQNHYSDIPRLNSQVNYSPEEPIAVTICNHCAEYCLWNNDVMVYPTRGNAPSPHADMPDDVKADYEEAALIADLSPKGAAALLRLAIQKLCIHLGGAGKNINDDIAQLVKGGLGTTVQQALDVVRVVGNNAVHPGQIDVDDPGTVKNLFGLLNVIVETMISVPKNVNTLYTNLPAGALQGIQRRDATP